MRGVPIKFRGVDENGHNHYGDLVHGRTSGETYIQILEHVNLFDEGEAFALRIKVIPDSIRQLVAYDANGEEIYEGDLVGEFFKFPSNLGTYFEWRAVSSLEGFLWNAKNASDSIYKDLELHISKIVGDHYSTFHRVSPENTIIKNRKKYRLEKATLKDDKGNKYDLIVPKEIE